VVDIGCLVWIEGRGRGDDDAVLL